MLRGFGLLLIRFSAGTVGAWLLNVHIAHRKTVDLRTLNKVRHPVRSVRAHGIRTELVDDSVWLHTLGADFIASFES